MVFVLFVNNKLPSLIGRQLNHNLSRNIFSSVSCLDMPSTYTMNIANSESKAISMCFVCFDSDISQRNPYLITSTNEIVMNEERKVNFLVTSMSFFAKYIRCTVNHSTFLVKPNRK